MYSALNRTDLALESAQSVQDSHGLPKGILLDENETDCFKTSDVRVLTREASDIIGKPVGRYLTLEMNARPDFMPENFKECVKELSEKISSFLGGARSALVAGLGNTSITPDSLGPKVFSKILATRHIRINAPELLADGMGEVSAIAPGVMGQTGIEASEIIKAVCESVKPELVVAVDALACSDIRHIGRTLQLTDSGISPGSGVMNKRKELSENSLGVKCLAIGLPTVADAKYESETMTLTPRSVDKMIETASLMISTALNRSLHPGLTAEEIAALCQ